MAEKESKGWEDPIVAEVRAVRDAYAKKFNYDLDAMCDDMRSKRAGYEKMGFTFVSLPAKKIQKRTGTDR